MAHYTSLLWQGNLASQRHEARTTENPVSASPNRASDSVPRSARSGTHDSKPRLSKDQQEFLESYFNNREHKPATLTKKRFATELGVPLDKVNNWFQNRRAKFKQDQKKLQDNFDHYYPPQTHDRVGTLDSGYVNSTFYHARRPATRPSMIPPRDEYVTTEFIESLCPGVNDSGNVSPEREPTLTIDTKFGAHPSDTSAFESFFGLDSSEVSDHRVEWDKLTEFRQQFNPCLELHEVESRTSLPFTHSASSLYTTHSNDESSSSFSNPATEGWRSSVSRHPSSATSTYQSSGRNSTSSWQSGFARERLVIEPDQTPMSHFSSWNLGAAPSFSSGAQGVSNMDMLHPMMGFSQPILPSQPENMPTLRQHEPIAEESPQTSDNEEQMADIAVNTVEIGGDPSELSNSNSRTDALNAGRNQITLRQASSASNLAARRQRRPAAISTNASRATSYNGSAGPASPSYNGPSLPADATLRRIKSSTGMFNGRVQKSTISSAQKSPLSLTFADPAVAPSLLKKASNHITQGYTTETSSVQPQNSMPAHSSPYAHQSQSSSLQHIPIMEAPNENMDHIWASMPSTADTVYSSIFSFGPVTDDTISSFVSPPATPMDATKFPYPTKHDSYVEPQSNTFQPPHSAPAWRQSFIMPQDSYAAVPQNHQLYEEQITPRALPNNTESQSSYRGHQRTPSVPTFMPGSNHSIFGYDQGIPTLQSVANAQSNSLKVSHVEQVPFFQADHRPSTALPHQTSPETRIASSGTTQHDLMIHEYSPQHITDRTIPQQRRDTLSQPREYIFTHQTPEHFSTP